MTFNDIKQGVYRRTGKNTASPDSTTSTRIAAFVNQAQRRLLSKPGLTRFRRAQITFDSVANQSRYALTNIASVQSLWETTNDREITPLARPHYRAINPDPSSTAGTPEHYVFLGYEPVVKQPSDASQVFVKSTSAADTTQTAYIEGIVSGGYHSSSSVTLTGATAVDLSGGSTWTWISKFYLSATAAGAVTLHEDSGSGTELARLAIGKKQIKHYVFDLHPQPSAVITYSADVVLAMTDMANDTDEPLIPEDFHDVLEIEAAMEELRKGDDAERFLMLQALHKDRMKDLNYWIARQGAGSEAPRGQSRLGAWFPAGS